MSYISYGMVDRALVRDSDLQPSPRALRDPRAWPARDHYHAIQCSALRTMS